MKKYEGLFIFSPQVTPEQLKEQLKGVDSLVNKFEGKVLQTNQLGRKMLGYEVKKHKDGNLVVIDIEMPPLKVSEFRRSLELEPNVLKYTLTVKDPRLEKAPVKPVAQPAPKAEPAAAK